MFEFMVGVVVAVWLVLIDSLSLSVALPFLSSDKLRLTCFARLLLLYVSESSSLGFGVGERVWHSLDGTLQHVLLFFAFAFAFAAPSLSPSSSRRAL